MKSYKQLKKILLLQQIANEEQKYQNLILSADIHRQALELYRKEIKK